MAKPSAKIPYLVPQELAGGMVKWHWKPSPRLRRLGYTGFELGTDFAKACQLAIAQNNMVDAQLQNRLPADIGHNGGPSFMDRIRTVAELVAAYTASDRFTALSANSQRTYRNELRKIMDWTDGGTMPVASITRTACLQLRDALVAKGIQRSATANFLRVLRLLLQYAVDREVIAVNPALKMDIPEADRRNHIIRAEAIDLLDRAADILHLPSMRLAMAIGFWTMQREGDLLAYTKADWRVLAAHDVPPEARAALIDPQGQIWGFRRRQSKTRAYIDAAVPASVRMMVESALAASATRAVSSFHILPDDRLGKAYSEKQFQRRFAEVRMVAWGLAMTARNPALARHIRKSQFRDFRRTGMCYFGELRVPVPLIAAISGHSITYTQKILDTYMPANTRFAIMGVAEAITRAAERSAIVERIER